MARFTLAIPGSGVPSPIDLAFLDLEDATRDLIDGDTKLVLVGGPPGIGKSENAMRVILEYSNRMRRRWEAKDDQDKLDDVRRTRYGPDGPEFNPPFVKIPGGSRKLPVLYCHLYWCSYPGEIGLIDDVPAIIYKNTQELLNDACDENRGGRVSCDVKTMPDPRVPSEYNHRGGLLVLHNWSQQQVEKVFHARVLSRAAPPIYFPSDPDILFRFVFRKAFVEKSLEGYLTRLNGSALGPSRGLGLSKTEADAVMADLAQFYSANRVRVKEHSFRTLRQWALQRSKYPTHWKRRAEQKLGPWPKRHH
jgi:hypothetical protein